jgi:hypothetical protein
MNFTHDWIMWRSLCYGYRPRSISSIQNYIWYFTSICAVVNAFASVTGEREFGLWLWRTKNYNIFAAFTLNTKYYRVSVQIFCLWPNGSKGLSVYCYFSEPTLTISTRSVRLVQKQTPPSPDLFLQWNS